MESEFKSGFRGLLLGSLDKAKRHEQFEITKEFLVTLHEERVKELASEIRPRLGLAAKNITLAMNVIGSLLEYLKENKIAEEYSATVKNLKICKIELAKQLNELSTSVRESNDSFQKRDLRNAVLLAEPAFNLRTGNSVAGVIEDTGKVLRELVEFQTLLRNQTRGFSEKYRLLIAPLMIRGDLLSLVKDHPAELTTPKNVKERSAPPDYVEKALGPVVAGAQAIKLGLSLAATLQLIGPEPTKKLRRLLGNYDDEFIALPKQPFMEARLKEEGERAYREFFADENVKPAQKFEIGFVSKEMPKGYFNFPGAGNGKEIYGASRVIKSTQGPTDRQIVASDEKDSPDSNLAAAELTEKDPRLRLNSNRGERHSDRGYDFPASVKVTGPEGEKRVVEKRIIVMFPPGIQNYERAMKSPEYLFRLMRELLRVELDNTGDLTGDSLKSVFVALIKLEEVSSQILFDALRIMAIKEPEVFLRTVEHFEDRLNGHQTGEPLHELQLLFTVVSICASKSNKGIPAELLIRVRELGERYYCILEQQLSDEPVSLNKIFLIFEIGSAVGIKPTAKMESYTIALMLEADIKDLSKGIAYLPGKGDVLTQQEYSAFLRRLLTLIKEKNYGGENKANGDEKALKSINVLLKLAEGKLEITEEELDQISKFVCELKGALSSQILPTLTTLLKLYRQGDLSPASPLVEKIFGSDLKQSRELQIGLVEYLASKGEEFAKVVANQIQRLRHQIGKTGTRRENEVLRNAQSAVARHLTPATRIVPPPSEKTLPPPIAEVKPEPIVTAPLPSEIPRVPRAQPTETQTSRSYYSDEIPMIVGKFSRQTPNKEMGDVDVAINQEDIRLTSRQILDVFRGFAKGDFTPRRSCLKLLNSLIEQILRPGNELTPTELFNLGDTLLNLRINDPRIVEMISSRLSKDPELLKRLSAAASLAIRYVAEYGEALPEILSEQMVIAVSRTVSLGYRLRLAQSLVRLKPDWSTRIIKEVMDGNVEKLGGDSATDNTLIKLNHLIEFSNLKSDSPNGLKWKERIDQALNRRIEGKKPNLNISEARVKEQLENGFGKENVEVEGFLPGLGYRVDYIVKDPVTNGTIVLEMDGGQFHETLKIDGNQIVVWPALEPYGLIRETLLKRRGVVVHLTWEEIKPYRSDETWLPNRLRQEVGSSESRR